MFSASTVEQSKNFQSLPAGIYRASITSVDLKKNKAGTGDFFEFQLSVVKPEDFNGAPVAHRLTFNNPSQVAVGIGRAGLADFTVAAGCPEFSSVEQLSSKIVGKEVVIETSVEVTTNNGRQYDNARVDNVWNTSGEHRNKARSIKELKLGPTGKAPVVKAATSAGPGVTPGNQAHEDVPFAPMNW